MKCCFAAENVVEYYKPAEPVPISVHSSIRIDTHLADGGSISDEAMAVLLMKRLNETDIQHR